jgi:periplasmic divalent cation tolerance protein
MECLISSFADARHRIAAVNEWGRIERWTTPAQSPWSMQMADSVLIALTTCPDDAVARQISETLIRERLATCINRISGMRSSYMWDGALQDESEILLMIKTTDARIGELEARLKAIHPYELPELLVLPVLGGNDRYLEWVRQGVAGKDE